jgi:uncharacterized protein YkwD
MSLLRRILLKTQLKKRMFIVVSLVIALTVAGFQQNVKVANGSAAIGTTTPNLNVNLSDISNHWAVGSIAWAIQQHIVQGYEDGTFKPDRIVTEPEFLVMLLKAFPDIAVDVNPGDAWYAPYYAAAKRMNWPVLNEYTSSRFDRGQVALLIASTQGQALDQNGSIQFLLDKGLSNGKTAKTIAGYRKQDKLTRAEAVRFIQNLVEHQLVLQKASSAALAASTVTTASPASSPADQAKSFAVSGIQIGDSISSVVNKLGEPARKDSSAYGFQWYIYNQDLTHYAQIGISGGQVVGLYTSAGNWTSPNGIHLGSSSADVVKAYANPLSAILKGNTNYLIDMSKQEYAVYLINGSYVTFFYDVYSNNTVTGIQVITKSEEENLTDFTALADASLRDSYEKEVFDLTNVMRVRFAKPTFAWDSTVAGTSRKHSKDMAVNNYFDHIDLQGLNPWDRGTADGIQYKFYSENIAAGQESAIFAIHGWMNSEGHRHNILGDGTRLGVGVYFGGSYKTYYTQNFYTPLK